MEKLSPQTFLATLDAGCCSVGLEIIGFNPNTDFTVRPWLSQTYKGTLHEGEIIVGSKINALKGDSMTFFNTKCTVAARLKETGTGLDNAVYATAATIKKLLESPAAAGRTMPQGAVSTILIKAKEGSDLDSIVRSINWSSKDIKAVKTKTLTASIAKSLSSISTVTSAMIAAVCLLCLLLMAIVFSLVSSERKKAFAILRVLGASKRKLTALVLSEAFIITAAGGLFGGTAGAILLLSFKAFIENFVSMPFLLPEPGILAANAIAVVVAAIAAGSLTAAATAYSISKTDTGIILKNGN